MRTLGLLTVAILISGITAPGVGAQNNYGQSPYAQPAPLTGSVMMNTYGAPAPTQATTLDSFIQQVLPYAANAYENRILRPQQLPQFDNGVRQSDYQNPPYSAQVTQMNQQNHAPYIWCQSVEGGYYDSSGTTTEHVRAPELYRWGGRFQDGTPVPAEPITSFNSMGHAYHTAATGGPSFWYQ